jgi:hypothetical protein
MRAGDKAGEEIEELSWIKAQFKALVMILP